MFQIYINWLLVTFYLSQRQLLEGLRSAALVAVLGTVDYRQAAAFRFATLVTALRQLLE